MGVLAAVSAAALIGLGGGSPASTPPEDQELEAMLLTVDDLPAGWELDTSGLFTNDDDDYADSSIPGDGAVVVTAPTTSGEDCDDASFEQLVGFDVDGLPSAEVAFVTADALGLLLQSVVRLPAGVDGRDLVERNDSMIARCATITGEDGPIRYDPLPFPALGDASSAYEVSAGGVPAPWFYVLVTVDGVMIGLAGLGEGIDAAVIEDLARAAVERAG